MDSKVCVVCNIEKNIDNFYNKYKECKHCNIKRSMKRYYENKDKLSNQNENFDEILVKIMKKIEICYLQSLN